MKRCFKCEVEKPLSEYYAHKGMCDGRLGKCKECAKSDVKANYRANLELMRDRRRYANLSDDAKRRLAENIAKQRQRHPEKYKARTAVGNALRDGRLVRKPCEHCSNPKSEGHHADYNHPLDVRWLCHRCHRKEHGTLVA